MTMGDGDDLSGSSSDLLRPPAWVTDGVFAERLNCGTRYGLRRTRLVR